MNPALSIRDENVRAAFFKDGQLHQARHDVLGSRVLLGHSFLALVAVCRKAKSDYKLMHHAFTQR